MDDQTRAKLAQLRDQLGHEAVDETTATYSHADQPKNDEE